MNYIYLEGASWDRYGNRFRQRPTPNELAAVPKAADSTSPRDRFSRDRQANYLSRRPSLKDLAAVPQAADISITTELIRDNEIAAMGTRLLESKDISVLDTILRSLHEIDPSSEEGTTELVFEDHIRMLSEFLVINPKKAKEYSINEDEFFLKQIDVYNSILDFLSSGKLSRDQLERYRKAVLEFFIAWGVNCNYDNLKTNLYRNS